MLLSPAAKAQTNSLLIEDMTWTEVRDAIACDHGGAAASWS
jgi:hypothetical protein